MNNFDCQIYRDTVWVDSFIAWIKKGDWFRLAPKKQQGRCGEGILMDNKRITWETMIKMCNQRGAWPIDQDGLELYEWDDAVEQYWPCGNLEHDQWKPHQRYPECIKKQCPIWNTLVDSDA